MELLIWLIVGLVAGVLASVVVGGIGYGILGDIVVGIVGVPSLLAVPRLLPQLKPLRTAIKGRSNTALLASAQRARQYTPGGAQPQAGQAGVGGRRRDLLGGGRVRGLSGDVWQVGGQRLALEQPLG